MTRTLLDLAKNNINVCDIVLNNREDNDEIIIDIVGFHVQQAVELAIKFLFEINGVEYPKLNDLMQLSYLALKSGIDLYLTEYLDDRLDVLNSWEANATRLTNYKLELNNVTEMLNEVKLYISIVEQKNILSLY